MLSRLGVIVTLLLFILAGPGASAAAAAGFSADAYMFQGGKQIMQGKMYMAKDRARFEYGGTVNIVRMDKKLVWMLMPSQKMYMEQSLRPENMVSGSERMPGEVERTLLGTETVNGYAANKYRITVQGEGKRQSMLQWLTVDGSLPVKTAAEDGRWVQEFRNIQMGEPDDFLFEVPPDYKKFAMGLSF